MTGWIRAPRWLALRLVAILILAAAGASFAQSYRGLYLWAVHHGLTGAWAAIWPLQIDTFIAVGELALFVALVDRWQRQQRAVAWTVAGAGLVVSVAGNVGHAPTHDLASRVTFAVPPLSAAVALFVGLVILKAVIKATATAKPVANVAAREVATARSGERAYGAGLVASVRPKKAAKGRTQRPPRRPKAAARTRTGRRPKGGQRAAAMAALVAAPDMPADELADRFGVSERTARRYRELAAAPESEVALIRALTESAP